MNPVVDLKTLESKGVLLAYQKDWIEDKSTVKVAEKSRRIGLTWAEAADDALFASSEQGDDVSYIGYNKEMAREFIDACAFWAKFYNLAAGEMEEEVFKDEDKDILAFRIKFESGWEIVALSSRPTSLRGRRGRVVIDEAAFHDDLKGLIKAAIALTMWGASVRIISSHNGDESDFNEMVSEIRAGRTPYSLHRITLDDALSDGLYKRICLVNKRDWSEESEAKWKQELIDHYGEHAEEELFCVPARGSGSYFSRALIESCMDDSLPVLNWTCKADFAQLPDSVREAECFDWCEENLKPLLDALPKNCRSWLGEDFGRSGDLSVHWPLIELPGLKYLTPFLLELSNVPFKQQEQILFYICDRLHMFCGAALDARGNGQYLAEVAMQRYGVERIAQVMLSEPWYRENMPPYKAAYEDKSVSVPKSADVVHDHRAIKMQKGVAKLAESKTKSEKGIQRHGDSAIAGALAWFAVRTLSGFEIGGMSSGTQRHALAGAKGF